MIDRAIPNGNTLTASEPDAHTRVPVELGERAPAPAFRQVVVHRSRDSGLIVGATGEHHGLRKGGGFDPLDP
jgi:hypothetical protein